MAMYAIRNIHYNTETPHYKSDAGIKEKLVPEMRQKL
jgi:hypothetical protein